MRRAFVLILILVLVLPVFAPFIPHGAMHVLYDSHVSSHNGSDHHSHHAHNHKHHHAVDAPRPLHLDFVSYFKDYLHVDLQKPEYVSFDLDISVIQDFDPPLEINIHSAHYKLASLHCRAPPDDQQRWTSCTPIYLSTQRLRI